MLVADIWINIPYLILLLLVGQYGIMSVLASYTAYCFAKGIVLQGMSNRHLRLSVGAHIRIHLRVIIRVTAMLLAVTGVGLFLTWKGSSIHLLATVQVIVGFVSMIVIVLLTDRSVIAELKTVFMPS